MFFPFGYDRFDGTPGDHQRFGGYIRIKSKGFFMKKSRQLKQYLKQLKQ